MPVSAVLAVLSSCARLEATAAAIPKAARLEHRCLAASIDIAAQSRPARRSEREPRRTGSVVLATFSAAYEHARCVVASAAVPPGAASPPPVSVLRANHAERRPPAFVIPAASSAGMWWVVGLEVWPRPACHFLVVSDAARTGLSGASSLCFFSWCL